MGYFRPVNIITVAQLKFAQQFQHRHQPLIGLTSHMNVTKSLAKLRVMA